MRILILFVDDREIHGLNPNPENPGADLSGGAVKLLKSGPGAVMAAWTLTRELVREKYDLVINAGIAGAYSRDIEIGKVVLVEEEEFADLGSMWEDGFRDIFATGLLDEDETPFMGGKLPSPDIHTRYSRLRHIPEVRGYTVSTAMAAGRDSGREGIESMEGAAVFYVCLMEGVPFIELRAVSNYVGETDRKKWDIELARQNLVRELEKLIKNLTL